MRPHIFITAEKIGNLRSVNEAGKATRSGVGRHLWSGIRSRAEADLDRPPLTPGSVFPEREEIHARHDNADWTVCFAAGQRILRAALVHLLTGDPRFRDLALRQITSLFDPTDWPMWCDDAHVHQGSPPCDLRTGMLCHDLSLAYDWLHPSLTVAQREFIVDGIDRRGIQPFLERIPGKPFWLDGTHNWTTCIMGGLAIAGMALGGDHPESQRLIDLSLAPMQDCLEAYGPEGEFNESVGYAGAIQLLVTYYTALRYHVGGKDNRLRQAPFPEACRWVIRFTNPPGHYVPFGDAHRHTPVAATYFAAVAAANRDPLLQWFFINHYPGEQELRHDCRAFLFFDHTVEAKPPESDLPLGRAYQAYGKCISSRTDWNPETTACVVVGKAGREFNHAHNDVGQVIIDGYAEPLIVDLGSCPYPSAELWDQREKFYNFGGMGHNIPMIGDRELKTGPDAQGEIITARFDPVRGACWHLDTTAVYSGARSVQRKVVHLFPGIVAVLDRVILEEREEVTLRWHTVDRSAPTDAGAFVVRGDRAQLAGQVCLPSGQDATIRRAQHAYKAPFDRNRLGELQVQKNESFIETRASGRQLTILSLFAVFPPDTQPREWVCNQVGDWTIDTPEGRVRVQSLESGLYASNTATRAEIRLA
jgi:hypothetical protein